MRLKILTAILVCCFPASFFAANVYVVVSSGKVLLDHKQLKNKCKYLIPANGKLDITANSKAIVIANLKVLELTAVKTYSLSALEGMLNSKALKATNNGLGSYIMKLYRTVNIDEEIKGELMAGTRAADHSGDSVIEKAPDFYFPADSATVCASAIELSWNLKKTLNIPKLLVMTANDTVYYSAVKSSGTLSIPLKNVGAYRWILSSKMDKVKITHTFFKPDAATAAQLRKERTDFIAGLELFSEETKQQLLADYNNKFYIKE